VPQLVQVTVKFRTSWRTGVTPLGLHGQSKSGRYENRNVVDLGSAPNFRHAASYLPRCSVSTSIVAGSRASRRIVRLRVPLVVDLRREPTEDALRLGLVGRRLAQVELAAGQRVKTGVHDDLERAAALADRTALTTAAATLAIRAEYWMPRWPPLIR